MTKFLVLNNKSNPASEYRPYWATQSLQKSAFCSIIAQNQNKVADPLG